MPIAKALRLPSFLLFLCFVLFAGLAFAQDESASPEPASGIQVTQAVAARDVQDREPVDAGTSFPPDIDQIVCFTRVEGAPDGTTLVHVWMHGDKEMARVELPVRGSPWRTWSKKRILPEWTGSWTVRIEDGEGNVLSEVEFRVGETS